MRIELDLKSLGPADFILLFFLSNKLKKYYLGVVDIFIRL